MYCAVFDTPIAHTDHTLLSTSSSGYVSSHPVVLGSFSNCWLPQSPAQPGRLAVGEPLPPLGLGGLSPLHIRPDGEDAQHRGPLPEGITVSSWLKTTSTEIKLLFMD